MKISAIAPWFGGKRTMAPEIIRQLGPHAAYWEPFCGSMAVLFAKDPAGHETVNDLHGDVINLAMVLASDRWGELYERLARVLYADKLFEVSKRHFLEEEPPSVPLTPSDVGDPHIERAYHFMVVSWIGRNGVAGTARVNYQMALRWTPNGGSGSTRFASAVDSMPDWHQRLRSVMILSRDAFKVLEEINDQEGVAIYADPPYFVETRGNGGGARYEHDFDDPDHARLAKSLQRFRHARVVVSYYADERLARLYPGWTVIDCIRHKHLHVQNRRGSKRSEAPEVLLINGPAIDTNGHKGLFGD